MNVKISEVEHVGGLLSRLFPVQSIRQLGAYIASTLVGFLLFQWILMLLDMPLATPIAIVGSFAGSVVILYMLLPGRFFIDVDAVEDARPLLDVMQARLHAQGYVIDPAAPAAKMRFRPNLPRLLRWEQNYVALDLAGARLTLTGSIFMMRILSGNLKAWPPVKL